MTRGFILGNPRSGTSLFRIMLDANSYISASPESGFLQWWYSKYKNWEDMSNHEEKIDSFLSDLKSSKKIETWNLDWVSLKKHILNSKPSNYGDLVFQVYLSYSKLGNKNAKVFLDKNNYYISHLDTLEKVWPDAKYIHIIRDGRDVACSYLEMQKIESNSLYKPNLASDIKTIANEWTENADKIESFFQSLPTSKHITIRYEDLVNTTEITLESICKFLSVPFEQEMLSYFQNGPKEPSQLIDWKIKTLEKPDPKNVGKYKFILSDKEISEFEKISGKTLRANNYNIL